MAAPLRFRYADRPWNRSQIRDRIQEPLDRSIGVDEMAPRYDIHGPWKAVRFDLNNGDVALFAYNDTEGYWMGNTETPQSLWRTNKQGWQEVPYPVSRWAQRELLATLHDRSPWLQSYPHLSWYFLPVLMSKDGRGSTRAFFKEHAAGFPDTTWQQATGFVESVLSSGFLDEFRSTMAGKLGTSEQVDRARMSSAISEFSAARLLVESGHEIRPEPQLASGHRLDFEIIDQPESPMVEVTRPRPPNRRSHDSPVAAVRQTAATKTDGQLAGPRNPLLFIDCSSFPQPVWNQIKSQQPTIGYEPAVIYRIRPSGDLDAYTVGSFPFSLSTLTAGQIEAVDPAK